MRELGKQGDSTSASLMMMWSVALTGSKRLNALSEEATRALRDLHSSRKNIERIETSFVIQHHGSVPKRRGISRPGGCTPKRPRKKDAPTMDKSIILRLATWLLRRKRSGA